MGSTGKSATTVTVPESQQQPKVKRQMQELESMLRALDGYDERFKDGIRKAEDWYSDEFPELDGYTYILFQDGKSVASVHNGSILGLTREYFNKDSDAWEKFEQMTEENDRSGWWTADTFSHERAHRLDKTLTEYMYSKRPTKDVTRTVYQDYDVNYYNKKYGLDVKKGEPFVVKTPNNREAFLTIGKNSYSTGEVADAAKGGSARISNVIVDEAVLEIQKNWRQMGFSKQPTKTDLVKGLSGYAGKHPRDKQETFAEAMSDYFAHGTSAKPFSQAIYTITKRAYDDLSRR